MDEICVVCGMPINAEHMEHKSVYKMKEYEFCSHGCKLTFDADPDYYCAHGCKIESPIEKAKKG